MSDQPTTGEKGGLPESLRAAIERTLEATASSAAGELLDEVARLGQQTSRRLAQGGRDARHAMTRRVEEMRPATEPSLQRLEDRVEALERRLAALTEASADSEPEVED